MLTKLYEVEVGPSGWEIAASILNVAADLLNDTSSENQEQAPQVSYQNSITTDLPQINYAEAAEKAKGYYKELLSLIDYAMEREDAKGFFSNAGDVLDMLRESDGSFDELVDNIAKNNNMDEIRLRDETKKCKNALEEYLPSVKYDSDNYQICRMVLKKYQKAVRQTSIILKKA